ncbi:MAG: thiol-disulfide oxidoreductase DCC family protein [Gemmobacter sp.]
MTQTTRVLYNDTCPICATEIGHYRRVAARTGLPVAFDPLDRAEDWGLTADQAARALHVQVDGRVLSGFDAFRALWAAMPGWRWLAWLAGLPVLRVIVRAVYDRIAAPLLYRAHRRRIARRG